MCSCTKWELVAGFRIVTPRISCQQMPARAIEVEKCPEPVPNGLLMERNSAAEGGLWGKKENVLPRTFTPCEGVHHDKTISLQQSSTCSTKVSLQGPHSLLQDQGHRIINGCFVQGLYLTGYYFDSGWSGHPINPLWAGHASHSEQHAASNRREYRLAGKRNRTQKSWLATLTLLLRKSTVNKTFSSWDGGALPLNNRSSAWALHMMVAKNHRAFKLKLVARRALPIK